MQLGYGLGIRGGRFFTSTNQSWGKLCLALQKQVKQVVARSLPMLVVFDIAFSKVAEYEILQR